MQPVFGVELKKVVEIIQQLAKTSKQPLNLEWGNIQSAQHLIDEVSILEKQGEYIKLHLLHECVDGFFTNKMSVNANKKLNAFLKECKQHRENINE